jgi:hypothetical protein
MKSYIVYEAEDGTVFKDEEDCRLFDELRNSEKRRKAVEKCEAAIRSAQIDLDILKGRLFSNGSNLCVTKYKYKHGCPPPTKGYDEVKTTREVAAKFLESLLPVDKTSMSFDALDKVFENMVRCMVAAHACYMAAKDSLRYARWAYESKKIDAQDYAYSLIVFAVAQFHQNVLLSRLRTARSIIKANKGKLRKLQFNPENLKHKSVKVQAKAAAKS